MQRVVVVGGGPAGLMAADVISAAGHRVTIYDRMPSLGRKLLMAGRGGLNLTHSEPLEPLLDRYGAARSWLAPAIRAFPPEDLVTFATALGQETFTGSSGRIFPKAMKASPLLRAWLARLASRSVDVRLRHRWTGFDHNSHATFIDSFGEAVTAEADAVVLALGGASWARLGSDGTWSDILRAKGIAAAPLRAANCGVVIAWSPHIADKFGGVPLKRIALTCGDVRIRGEALVTRTGLEGNAVYAVSGKLRAMLDAGDTTTLNLDLRPDMRLEELSTRLARPRGKDTVSNWLRKTLSLAPVEIALLRETTRGALPTETTVLAGLIKSLEFTIAGLAPIDRAISTAGGLSATEFDAHFMLLQRPGVFAAGEMLDWEAPTGGYLLQACFATGHVAGQGALRFLAANRS